MKCWGVGRYGSTTSLVPADVPGLTTGVIDIDLESLNLCAVMSNGEVRCSGQNQFGEAGGTPGTARNTPTLVANISGASSVSMGSRLSCVTVSGTVKCWGTPYYPDAVGNVAPVSGIYTVPGLTNVSELANSGEHLCARVGGIVQCIGRNGYGELGDGTYTDSATPVTVQGLSSTTNITASGHGTCAVDGGALKCWGYVMNPSFTNLPVTRIASGVTFASTRNGACAATTTGAMCFGEYNTSGRLGDGSTSDQLSPVPVTGLTMVQRIHLGGQTSCAITTDGRALCWGENSAGQVGDGTTTDRLTPVEVLRP